MRQRKVHATKETPRKPPEETVPETQVMGVLTRTGMATAACRVRKPIWLLSVLSSVCF
jgi:hypothetical protein